MNNIVTRELSDYQREQEILRDEIAGDKDCFANQIKDELGEEIKKQLMKKEQAKKEPAKKKMNIFKRLIEICQ